MIEPYHADRCRSDRRNQQVALFVCKRKSPPLYVTLVRNGGGVRKELPCRFGIAPWPRERGVALRRAAQPELIGGQVARDAVSAAAVDEPRRPSAHAPEQGGVFQRACDEPRKRVDTDGL